MQSIEQIFLKNLQEITSDKTVVSSTGDEIVESDIQNLSVLFRHHDAHPLTLLLALLKIYKPTETEESFLSWDSDALWQTVQQDFGSISELNKNKIQAVRTLLISDDPWLNWEAFLPICMTLNNNIPIFSYIEKPTVIQLMAAIDMMNTIRKEIFADEIARFIAACFWDESVFYAPEPLSFAQDRISRKTYKCLDCGNIDEYDLEDGICDNCAQRFSDSKLNFKVPQDRLEYIKQTGQGTRLQIYYEYPFAAVKDRLEKYLNNPGITLRENATDIQVAHLYTALKYIKDKQKQAIKQMQNLGLL